MSAAFLIATPAAESATEPFFIGTFSQPGKESGILLAALDSQTGRLTGGESVAEASNPGFLVLSDDGKCLYAALDRTVRAYRIGEGNRLTLINEQPSGGDAACHLWFGAGHLFVSNYSGGNVNCLPVRPDGSLGESAASVAFSGSGPNPARQQKPFAHGALLTPDKRFVYVCDLGTDQIWIFRFNPGSGEMLAADPPSGKVPPGGGPRHLVLSPKADHLYVNNEMGLSVSVFQRDVESGSLTLIQTIPTLPEGAPHAGVTTSAIAIHPANGRIYVSNRGHNSITVFEIESGGTLKFLQNVPATVEMPREFVIDPSGSWLVVGGQQDGVVASLKIDPSDGTLSPADRLPTGFSPVSFSFLP